LTRTCCRFWNVSACLEKSFHGWRNTTQTFLSAWFPLRNSNSLGEGLSGALIEAMAASVPCVATDIPGNRELIQHEVTGLLVPTKDPKALAHAIERLLLDTDLAQRLAKAGYQLVAKAYDESVEKAGWVKLFSAICWANGIDERPSFPAER